MGNNIEGKIVLITGGRTGLGAETARHLAASGARIAVAARRKDKLARSPMRSNSRTTSISMKSSFARPRRNSDAFTTKEQDHDSQENSASIPFTYVTE